MSIQRHTLYNLGGHVASLGILLATVPWYLQIVGLERYGVLSIIWLVLGYFGMFDLGIGRAIAQRIARLGNRQREAHNSVLWSGLAATVPSAVIGTTALFFAIKTILTYWVEMGPALHSEINDAVVWVALCLGPLVFSECLRGALLGHKRFLAINVVDVTSRVLTQVLPLVAAVVMTPDLPSLTRAVFAARTLSLLVWLLACRAVVPGSLVARWSPRLVVVLVRYGGWVTLGALMAPLLSGLERVFIGNLQGASSVPYYAVPFSLVAPIALLASSLSVALFPRFSALTAADAIALAKRAVAAILVLLTPVLVVLASVIRPFLGMWISPEFAVASSDVAHVLIVGFWANALAKVFHAKLQGEGRPSVVAWAHVAQLVPHLALLALLTSAWGIVGAALAWTLRAWADLLILGSKSHAAQWRSPLIWGSLGLVVLACAFGHVLGPDLRLQIAAGVALTALALAWSLHYGLAGHLRTLIARPSTR